MRPPVDSGKLCRHCGHPLWHHIQLGGIWGGRRSGGWGCEACRVCGASHQAAPRDHESEPCHCTCDRLWRAA